MPGAATPALVAAERAGIRYQVHEYAHDPESSSYGLEAADRLGVERVRVFKTLVVTIDGTPHVAILPVAHELDVRSLGKRSAMVPPAEAERLTGYVTGGISPLGQRRRLPTLVDQSAFGFETIYVSAGRRGLELELAPDDLVRLTGARTVGLAARR
jgi:Cys-tRNA(Pro)/Cys-tRNA(Cys) deacylase